VYVAAALTHDLCSVTSDRAQSVIKTVDVCPTSPLTPRATGLDWQPSLLAIQQSGCPAGVLRGLCCQPARLGFTPASRRRIFSFDDRNALLIEAKPDDSMVFKL
jgi:hypothetical protein